MDRLLPIIFVESEKMSKFARMKTNVLLLLAVTVLLSFSACSHSEKDQAAELLSQIEKLYDEGNYQEALDSITSLRHQFPEAVEARRKALVIWQNASLKQAQEDIGRTDSALQATIAEMNAATTIRERNRIGMRRDSLQVRYDVLVGTVRVIHRRQSEK